MIYLIILAHIFLISLGLFYLYWPSRQFLTATINDVTFLKFPPEYGFLFFALSMISFFLAFLYFKYKKRKKIGLFFSIQLILYWIFFMFTLILDDLLIILRPELVGPSLYNTIAIAVFEVIISFFFIFMIIFGNQLRKKQTLGLLYKIQIIIYLLFIIDIVFLFSFANLSLKYPPIDKLYFLGNIILCTLLVILILAFYQFRHETKYEMYLKYFLIFLSLFSVIFLISSLSNLFDVLRSPLSVLNIIGFQLPTYTLAEGWNLDYMHFMLVLGAFGLILFYKSYNELIADFDKIQNKIREVFPNEYKVSTIVALTSFFIVFAILFIISGSATLFGDRTITKSLQWFTYFVNYITYYIYYFFLIILILIFFYLVLNYLVGIEKIYISKFYLNLFRRIIILIGVITLICWMIELNAPGEEYSEIELILLLISSVILSVLISSVILVYSISRGKFSLDKQKLFIKRNSIGLATLLIVVIAIILDLLFIFFYSNIPNGESFYWRFRDVITNALYTGMIYLQISLGITLVYKILKFPNFAQAEFVTFGAYIAFVFGVVGETIKLWDFNILGTNYSEMLGFFKWIPMLVILCVIAFIVTAILGIVFDTMIFKPLRKQDASPATLMIASFAIGLAFRMVLQQIFSANPLSLSRYFINIKLDSIALRILIILAVLVSTWFFQILLYDTKYGKIMRAVSDNEDLAKVSGIKAHRIHYLVWIIAAGFAGVAGVLFTSYPVGAPWIKPDVGFILLLSAFAVAVLGGIGSFEGVILASLIVGFTENMGVIFLSQLGDLKFAFKLRVIGQIDLFLILLLVILVVMLIIFSRKSPNALLMSHPYALLFLLVIPVIFLPYFISQLFASGLFPQIFVAGVFPQLNVDLSFDAGYKVALSYLILIIVLKIRPYGLLGEPPSGDR